MNTTTVRNPGVIPWLGRIHLQRGLAFGAIILGALLAFEVFNYSTTDFALSDLLGDLSFLGIRWATILAIAFCSIDFAGIARLFTPEEGADEPNEVWYLFGAWLLAATMNAMLTWWGVSIAILNHPAPENSILGRDTILRVVPVFVAVLVWLMRVLIIGTFSVAGDRLFSQGQSSPRRRRLASNRTPADQAPISSPSLPTRVSPSATLSARHASRVTSLPGGSHNRPEPTYHSPAINASPVANSAAHTRQ